jgi:anti-sigma regulatory factor (Ser/Thr protein kinase)
VEVSTRTHCEQEFLDVSDPTHTALVRRRALHHASLAGFDERLSAAVALIASEGVSNIVKHAGSGGVILGRCGAGDATGISLSFYDRGPGMNLKACLPDGVSSSGTLGHGLGAIARGASRWDAYSRAGGGSVVWAELWKELPVPAFDVGAVCAPYPGEPVAGDGWGVEVLDDDTCTVMVVDGLGHGASAAEAARAALNVLRDEPALAPGKMLERAHAALRATRGAAAAVGRLERNSRLFTYAAVGNIGGVVWGGSDPVRSLVSQHGIVGHTLPRVREERYALAPGASVILYSDGIKTRWELDAALALSKAATVATVLWRDHARGRDDATALVVRPAEAA